jgi:hypothetical protein
VSTNPSSRARKIGTDEVVPVPIGIDDLFGALGRAAESAAAARDRNGMPELDLLAIRIVTRAHTPTLAEIQKLRDASYRGWIRGDERRVLRGHGPLGDGWTCVDVSTFGEETWQVERDGTPLPDYYSERSDAVAASWVDAFNKGRQTQAQMLAVMMRPPEGYAVILVAGVSLLGSRLGPWSEV